MNKCKEFKKINRAVSKAIDVPLMDVKNIANMVMDYYPTPYYVCCLDSRVHDESEDACSAILTKIYFLVSNEEEAWKLYNKYCDEHSETINSALPWGSFTRSRLDQDEFIDCLFFVSHPKYYLAKKEKIITVNVAVQEYMEEYAEELEEDEEEYEEEDVWFDVSVYKYKNNQHKIIPY